MDRPTREPPPKLAFSINEAVAATSLGRSTLYRHINAGTLATVKVGGRRLIPLAAIQALMGDRVPLGEMVFAPSATPHRTETP